MPTSRGRGGRRRGSPAGKARWLRRGHWCRRKDEARWNSRVVAMGIECEELSLPPVSMTTLENGRGELWACVRATRGRGMGIRPETLAAREGDRGERNSPVAARGRAMGSWEWGTGEGALGFGGWAAGGLGGPAREARLGGGLGLERPAG